MSDIYTPGSAHGPEGHAPAGTHAVRFERDDIQAGPVVWFVVGLIIVTALTMAGVWGMMAFFNKTETASKKSTWQSADPKGGEGTDVPLAVGPIDGDEGRDRLRPHLERDMPARNRSSLGNTPRLEGIDLHNTSRPDDYLPEHTIGRIWPSAAAEQKKADEKYLESWSKKDVQGPLIQVPIDVAMKHIAKAGSAPLPRDEWQNAPGRSSSGRVSRIPGANAAVLGHDPGAPKQDADKGHEPEKKDHPEEPKK